jgi:hypothetical protein
MWALSTDIGPKRPDLQRAIEDVGDHFAFAGVGSEELSEFGLRPGRRRAPKSN